jgi:coenzyme F420-reducing hydrogenase beta subunit
MSGIVREIVQKGLCSGCGVCAGLCPADVLSMGIQLNGDLAPRFDLKRCADKCNLCLAVCPFVGGVYNPRRLNTELYSGKPNVKFTQDIGWYLHSIAGFREDEGLRKASASGGLATWCLETVLKEGLVNHTAVIRLSKDQAKGFFEFSSVSTVGQIRESSGSVYHPVEISGILKAIQASEEESWAIIGVPCLCAAIRGIGSLRKKVPFIFGLACGMYQNIFYTEMLLSKSAVDRKRIIDIEYRRKHDDGLPFNYWFRGTDNRGPGREIAYRGLPYFLGKNAFFRQNACNFCMDVFAEAADACFMDAWLPEYSVDPRGTSIVLIRNEEISKLFQQGEIKGEIRFKNISAEQAVANQQAHVRYKRELIYMRLRVPPDDDKGQVKPTFIEKISWLLQQRAQIKSKKVWAKYGREYGLSWFWLAIADVLSIQIIINAVSSLSRLLGKLISGWRKGVLSNM